MAKQKVDTTNYCNMSKDDMYGLYRVKSSPFFWRQKAEQLNYSANILLPKAIKRIEKISEMALKDEMDLSKTPPDTFSTAYGLLGFSLECLFKACIIRDNPGFVDKGMQNDELKSHNLLKLADLGKISLSNSEKGACEKLTEYMYVDFRYPIDRVLKPTSKGLFNMYSKNIVEEANQIFARLHKITDQWHFAKGGEAPTGIQTSNIKIKKPVKSVFKRANRKT